MNSFSEIVHACNLKAAYEDIYNRRKFKGMPHHLTPTNANIVIKNNVYNNNQVVDEVKNISREFIKIVRAVEKAKKLVYKETAEV